MSDLLGMSFDSSASPTIRLRAFSEPTAVDESDPGRTPTGWGFAWYPVGEAGAVVVKDPVSTGDTPLSRVLRDWERFRATTFLCHVRGAAKRVSQADTHPFLRSYAGRDWLLVHNGQLDARKLREENPGETPLFEPVGRTDSEQVLCTLLGKLHAAGVRSLSEVGWGELHGWLRDLNALGTMNLLLSDGIDIVAYRDQGGFSDLHMVRRRPPHADTLLKNRVVALDLGDPLDINRTMVLFATRPISKPGAPTSAGSIPAEAAAEPGKDSSAKTESAKEETSADVWEAIEPGTMMVARLGAITWRSDDHRSVEPKAKPVAPVGDRITEPPPTLMRAVAVPHQSQAPVSPAAAGADSMQERVVTVTHETSYTYEEAVEQSSHIFRLRPVDDVNQSVLEHSLQILPDGESFSFEDVFGNRTTTLRVRAAYEELKIVARSKLRIYLQRPVASRTLSTTIPLVWMPWQRQMMLPYLLPPELPETQLRELSDYAMSFVERQDYDLVDTLHDINMTIRQDFAYVSKSTSLETTPFDVYVSRRGVCQDFANLFICLARLLGVPARYRVGYIHTGADYENQIQSEASHAWVEVYLPWAGWRGYDPTNGCLAGLDHVRVAVGRNYRDATPTSGTIYKGGRGERLSVSVRVEVEGETPDAPKEQGAA
ncbi:MAG: class II glutamine amidotransferase [Myxococcota bacterium]